MSDSPMRSALTGAAVLAFLVLLAGQAWSLNRLNRTVADLTAAVESLETKPATAPKVPPRRTALPRRPAPVRKPPRLPVKTPPPVDRDLDGFLDEEEREAMELKGERWIASATARTSLLVNKLVEAGKIPSDAADESIELIIAEMYDTWQLKLDVVDGTISESEAKAEYQDLRADTDADLEYLLGTDVAIDFRRFMDRKTD